MLPSPFDEGVAVDLRRTINQLNSQIGNTYDAGVERLLDRMGYEPKRNNTDMLVPALSIFGAGLVVGVSLGLLFAPKRGSEVRGDIRHRLDDLRVRGNERYEEIRSHRLEGGEG